MLSNPPLKKLVSPEEYIGKVELEAVRKSDGFRDLRYNLLDFYFERGFDEPLMRANVDVGEWVEVRNYLDSRMDQVAESLGVRRQHEKGWLAYWRSLPS